MMKNKLTALAAAVMLTVLSVTPVYAHGTHHRRTEYTVCTVTDCVKTGKHSHDGKYFYSHHTGRSAYHH